MHIIIIVINIIITIFIIIIIIIIINIFFYCSYYDLARHSATHTCVTQRVIRVFQTVGVRKIASSHFMQRNKTVGFFSVFIFFTKTECTR